MDVVARRRGSTGTGLWIALALTLISAAALFSLGTLTSRSAGGDYAVSSGQTLTVMTRNLYLGGNIDRPIRAAIDRTGAEGVLALGHANHELQEIVERTDFRTRSRLLADEIAAAQPDLVGLQEVAMWRHGPIELDKIGQPNATEVDYDFLAILLSDLASRGIRYEVASTQQESDVEAPAFTGNPWSGTAGSAEDVRLTDRDVILLRSDSGIRIEGRGGGHYTTQFKVQLGDVTFPFVRGYAWADIAVGSATIRFITTHLESHSAKLARAQAEELLKGPGGNPGLSTVIVCDCNSNPASPAARVPLPIGSGAAYRLLTKDHGFTDLWVQQPGPGDLGSTASLGELVNDKTPDFNRRIDLVLARPATPVDITASRAELTGNELQDRDPATGLWPSDHAGVVVQLQVGPH
jgi:endonuclease/exonuclease/phosphatase family metal-dependent hydrolase